jgi:hypothetical protein
LPTRLDDREQMLVVLEEQAGANVSVLHRPMQRQQYPLGEPLRKTVADLIATAM